MQRTHSEGQARARAALACRLASAACTAASPTPVSTPAGRYEKGAGGSISACIRVVLRIPSATHVHVHSHIRRRGQASGST